jgi:ATP-dependent DNA helicase RecG
MITKEELELILKDVESDRVERTISVSNTDKFGEAICAFANDLPFNQKPGYLIIGVNDDGYCCKLEVTDQLLQNLSAIRTDGNIIPPPSMIVQKFKLAMGELAVVEVQPHIQPPVKYKNRIWVRVGPTKRIANDADEFRLNERRSSQAKTFDTLPCFGSTIDDISVDIFKTGYLPFAIEKETLEANHRDIKLQLSSLKFYDLVADCPTNAGILMFGKNPKFFLPGAYIQFVRFTGNDESSDFDFEKEISGDLFTQLRNLNEFINTIVIRKVLHNLGEEFQYNYPPIAIRELLFNSIIHKNYQSNAPIRFYEYSDRIEISNSGSLYGDAKPENFPNKNDYRNPALAEAARYSGYINKFSVGVRRAKQALAKNNSPEPLFLINESTYFQVTIFKKEI